MTSSNCIARRSSDSKRAGENGLHGLKPLITEGKYFEGPRWHDRRLWFVDSLAMTLQRVSPAGECETVCRIPGIAGGIGFLPSGDPVICLDREGAVWTSLFQEDAFVRVDATGRILDRISVTGRRAVACALGGEDRRTLFCISAKTTQEDLMRGNSTARIDTVRIETPGASSP